MKAQRKPRSGNFLPVLELPFGSFFAYSRGEEFEITPMSSELLFYPASRVVTITGK